MSLTAEYHVRTSQLPLSDVAAAMPTLTVQLEGSEQLHSGSLVLFIRATGLSFDGLDTALADAPIVEDKYLISEGETVRRYQLITIGRRPPYLDDLMTSRMLPETITVLPDGWRITQQFADRDAFATCREFWRDLDASFHLERLYDSHTTDAELIGLTGKQREALLAAYEEGYFAVPRQASMAAVTATLDISVSALVERLYRAQAHLIEHFVCSGGYKTPESLGTV